MQKSNSIILQLKWLFTYVINQNSSIIGIGAKTGRFKGICINSDFPREFLVNPILESMKINEMHFAWNLLIGFFLVQIHKGKR